MGDLEAELTDAQRLIVAECDALKTLLLEKNRNYGNSALNPIGVFTPGLTAELGIRVRIDDKLNRLKQGKAAGEDVERDLLGYLILLRVARRLGEASHVTADPEPTVLRPVVERPR